MRGEWEGKEGRREGGMQRDEIFFLPPERPSFKLHANVKSLSREIGQRSRTSGVCEEPRAQGTAEK